MAIDLENNALATEMAVTIIKESEPPLIFQAIFYPGTSVPTEFGTTIIGEDIKATIIPLDPNTPIEIGDILINDQDKYEVENPKTYDAGKYGKVLEVICERYR